MTPAVAGMALLVGLGADLAVRAGVVGVGGALAIGVTAAVLLGSGRIRDRDARFAVLSAPVFGSFLAVRTSGWLLPLDVIAAGGLLAVGASFGRSGSLTNIPLAAALARAWHGTVHLILAPSFLPRSWNRDLSGMPVLAVARGLLLAAPVVFVLGGLLASADAFFASLVRFDADPGALGAHAAIVVVGTWLGLGLLRVASASPPPRYESPGWRLGSVEAGVLLGSVVALFGVFVGTQVAVALGGGRHVIETAGLTYAEHARSGFFQLLWVAAATLAGLLVIRGLALGSRTDGAAHRRLLLLAETVVGLTVVIVLVALRRLDLYTDAYGLTMLRLYSSLFAAWIGAVHVLFGVGLAGVGGPRAWFPTAAASAGLVILLGLNVVNPEAVVVRDVLSTPGGTVADLDLAELSDDAVPAVVAAVERDAASLTPEVSSWLCRPRDDAFDGWAAANLDRSRAQQARERFCR